MTIGVAYSSHLTNFVWYQMQQKCGTSSAHYAEGLPHVADVLQVYEAPAIG
jgi:hypothetical protein